MMKTIPASPALARLSFDAANGYLPFARLSVNHLFRLFPATMKIPSFFLCLLALSPLSLAAEPVPSPTTEPVTKELLQFALGRQMIWRPSPPMLNKVPGVVYATEPPQPIISHEKNFSDTQKILNARYATWAGLPAVAVAPNGRLWVAYTTGGDGEHDHFTKNQVVLFTATSIDR